MVKRVGGSRKKSRSKFRKPMRSRGKVSMVRYFQVFKVNDQVKLNADASQHIGFYHQRFHGKSGIVLGKRGRCYEVMIKDRNKKKLLIVHPVHLRREGTFSPKSSLVKTSEKLVKTAEKMK